MIPKGWEQEVIDGVPQRAIVSNCGKYRIPAAIGQRSGEGIVLYSLFKREGKHWNLAREAPFTSASEAAGYSIKLENMK